MLIRRVLTPGRPSNRLLRIGLGALALAVSLVALGDLLRGYPFAVDLEIALRAADRWMSGGQPYLADAFTKGSGYELPFLYPPYALPLFAPLATLDRSIAWTAWFVAVLLVAILTCRRLGIPLRWMPAVLVWPPFAEGILSGNVQVFIFAAFVALLVGRGEATARDDRRPAGPWLRGLLIAVTTFLKVSQPHVLVNAARWERRAAAVAVVAVALLALASVAFMGTGVWFDWIDQLRRAADPDWALGGPSLSHRLPAPLGPLIVVGCLAAVLAVPKASAAAWVGVLLVLGATSLHTYYLLFLLPAMLRIRLEIALLAVLLIATYTEPSWWAAIAIVTGALALSRAQPGLLEERRGTPPGELEVPATA